MAETIGTAYIQIEPSAKGITGKIEGTLNAESSNAGKSAGAAFSGAFGTALKVGGVAIAATTAAVTGFGKAAVSAGMDFDSSMSQVAATMGYSVSELNDSSSEAYQNFEKLRDFAQEMGSSTVFSATQSADALNYMALAGYDAEQSMEMLPAVLDLAAAGGMELARASDMVTDAQSALGLSTEETFDMVDMMARTASKANTSVEQLGDAILKVGPTARDVSGGVQEMSAVLGTLANSGIKGTEAGTHLRNMLLSMSPQTDKAAMAWERLGMTAYDVNGDLRPLNETFEEMAQKMSSLSTEERTRMIKAMFNKTDLASINTMLSATIGNAKDVSEAFEAAGLSFDDFVNKEDGSNSLSQAMTDAFFELKNGTLETKEQIDLFSESLMEMGFTTEQASTFMDAFLSTADAGANDFEILNEKISDFDNAASDMAEVQLDNLAGDITLFESALEGAKIAVSDQLTPTLREFVQFGSDALSSLTQSFKADGMEGLFAELGNVLSNGLSMLVDNLPGIAQAGLALLQNLLTGVMELLPTLLPQLVQLAVQMVQMLAESLPTIITSLVDALVTAVPLLLDALPKIIIDVVNALIACLPTLISGTLQLVVGIVQALPQIIMTLIDALPSMIGDIVVAIIDCLPQLIDGCIQLIIGLVLAAPQIIESLILAIPKIFMEIVDAILENGPKLLEAGKSLLESFKKGFETIKDVGKNMIKGLWEGINDMKNWIINKVKSFCSSVIQPMIDFFKIGSPSKLMRDEIGKWIPAGIAVGIDANADSAIAEMDDLGNRMNTTLSRRLETVGTDAKYGMQIETTSSRDNQLFDMLAEYLPQIAQGNSITLEGDMKKMFRAVKKQNDIYRKSNGRSAFA